MSILYLSRVFGLPVHHGNFILTGVAAAPPDPPHFWRGGCSPPPRPPHPGVMRGEASSHCVGFLWRELILSKAGWKAGQETSWSFLSQLIGLFVGTNLVDAKFDENIDGMIVATYKVRMFVRTPPTADEPSQKLFSYQELLGLIGKTTNIVCVT